MGNPTNSKDSVQATGSGFKRDVSLGANVALGFTYMSPLVGIFSLVPLALTTAGPPAIWWIVMVACGQMLVALVFGEIVSQYPITGGLYPWSRRLWGRRYAWLTAWIYLCAITLTVTSVAAFAPAFVGSLFGFDLTRGRTLAISLALLAIALLLNMGGTKVLARAARVGFLAEIFGVLVVGIFLLLFKRENSIGIFFDGTFSQAAGNTSFMAGFILAALTGLYLFYGFEACGDIAEEVTDPERRIPVAMILTIVVGGGSALTAFVGIILAAPNLNEIAAGEVADPVGAILGASLGTVGEKAFIVIGLTAFVSCVLSLQAALSRTLFSFARDNMLPASRWLSRMSEHRIPQNALVFAAAAPAVFTVYIYIFPGSLYRLTAFAVAGIYVAFQMVVLAALRQRLRGWSPGGVWNLGRWGLPINILALCYGIASLLVLTRPGDASLVFVDRWIVLVGLATVIGAGLLYMLTSRPFGRSMAPEGDAIESAAQLRAARTAGLSS